MKACGSVNADPHGPVGSDLLRGCEFRPTRGIRLWRRLHDCQYLPDDMHDRAEAGLQLQRRPFPVQHVIGAARALNPEERADRETNAFGLQLPLLGVPTGLSGPWWASS